MADASAPRTVKSGAEFVYYLAPPVVVALGVMLVGGLGAASLVRGITPSLLEALYPKLWMFSAGSLVVAIIAGAITFFVAKKRSG